ncbi:STAS domain-containing protein [Lentzea flaviverrucosa]|uniref:RsbT co-antagonist protein RsbR n=1 Tax=Lentzea flaviverrucosa TaxID=200379 RepID=A0A1H9A242_9PSEU|nr:STAS domain-containing protein [Lentzea flaviverrucosa]RDI32189.1 rsbT co-antagonist protein RsbR [Lentzea flaviverrucosa]SEP70583.1 rsbT co-antagonist protein RsbR [Lentzea flaviverrucosa]
MTADAGRARSLTDLIRTEAEPLIEKWVDAVAALLRGRQTRSELDRDFREFFAALLPLVGNDGRDISGPEFGDIRSLLDEYSRTRVRAGFTPTETASSLFSLKRVVFELTENNDDPQVYRQQMAFSGLLDALGLLTFESYAQARDEIIREQSEQLLELTTPVVKIWEGVLAVPLVGTLDSARTQVVMEKLLEALVETGSEHAIIDITGVSAVDTQVAQHLLKTVVAARLMGAECIVSGIRPQIAQTIVALGIEFGDIVTKASLADALRHALRREGVDVVRSQAV